MNDISRAKTRIRAALESGMCMTTAQGNRIGQTVDFRKIISRLKSEGFNVQSYWNERNGRRWKTYFYQNILPKKGTKIQDFGQPKLDLE